MSLLELVKLNLTKIKKHVNAQYVEKILLIVMMCLIAIAFVNATIQMKSFAYTVMSNKTMKWQMKLLEMTGNE